jgi:hypothetical protein
MLNAYQQYDIAHNSTMNYLVNEANKQQLHIDLFHVFLFLLRFRMLFCRLLLSNIPFTASNGNDIILYEMSRFMTAKLIH